MCKICSIFYELHLVIQSGMKGSSTDFMEFRSWLLVFVLHLSFGPSYGSFVNFHVLIFLVRLSLSGNYESS